MRKLLCLVFVLLLSSALVSQLNAQDNIYTDRPTQTTSSAAVPMGAFQFETGFYMLEYSSSNLIGGTDKYQYFSINNTLLRYGISDRIELRFYQEMYSDRLVSDGSTAFSNSLTFVPTMIGAKFNLVQNNPNLPDIGLIASFGGGVFEETGNGLQSDIRFAFDGSLGQELSISSNLGLSMSNGFDFVTPFYTLVLGHSLDNKIGIFVEAYGSFPEIGTSSHSMDAGLTYLLNSSLQLDVYGGTGLSNGSANLLLGFGLSKRFLK